MINNIKCTLHGCNIMNDTISRNQHKISSYTSGSYIIVCACNDIHYLASACYVTIL